ncbi:MAG: hypothetical protein PVF62_04615 [Desulfobacterales bacterium]
MMLKDQKVALSAKGDARDISLLANNELAITQEFNKMVEEIVNLTKVSPENPTNKRSVLAK